MQESMHLLPSRSGRDWLWPKGSRESGANSAVLALQCFGQTRDHLHDHRFAFLASPALHTFGEVESEGDILLNEIQVLMSVITKSIQRLEEIASVDKAAQSATRILLKL